MGDRPPPLQVQGLYLHTTAQHKRGHTSVPRPEFEPTIAVLELPNKYNLHRTAIGPTCYLTEFPTHKHRDLLTYDGVSKSFRTGRLQQERQMVQLFATRCSRIAICESV
jgi:hypothetical protein